jgi:protein SCO1/2
VSPARARRLAWIAPALALVVVGGIALAHHLGRPAPAEPLPDLGRVPEVALIDQRGAAFSTADLRGRPTIVNFVFTRCTTICPVTSLKMARLAERTAGHPVALLSVSVDPEHDRPEVLATFAARYHADPVRWRFATGDPEALRRAVEDGFHLAIERRGLTADGAPDIVHGGHFVLVDGDLAIRGYYDSEEPARLDALAADAIGLAEGAR